MKKIIVILLILLFTSSVNSEPLNKKFQLPEYFPYNYYVEEFWTKDTRYQEIIPTKLDWLFILIVKKPDINNFSEYSDEIVYLLDNRKGYLDKRSRMIMILHTKKEKFFFSAIDKTYIDQKLGIDDNVEWEIIKNKNINNSQELLASTIEKLHLEENLLAKSQI